MAQSISFNNTDLYQAGAYTKVNADALLAPSVLSGNRLALIGPAKRGKPGVVHRFKVNGDALATFGRDNPLRYGCRFAFAHGAIVVEAVRVGNPTQATATGQGLIVTARDWGADYNGIRVTIAPGTNADTFKVTVSWTDPDTHISHLQIQDNLADRDAALEFLNSRKSTLVSAVIDPDSEFGAGVLTLADGNSDLTPTFADWQSAIELFRAKHINILVPITDDEAVHTACSEFMNEQASTQHRKEGRVVAGGALDEDLADIVARAGTQSSKRFQLLANGIESFNDAGVRTMFSPAYTACALAGLQAMLGVSEPATTKFLTGVTGLDREWSSVDKDRLIAAGVVFVEENPDENAGGFRFHRDITTHTVDNVWEERTTVTGIDFVALNMRRLADKVMIGKGTTATRLNLLRQKSIIMLKDFVTDGFIASHGAVVISADQGVVRRQYEVSPVFGANFVLDDISVVPA